MQLVISLPLINDLGAEELEYSQKSQTEYQKLMRGQCPVLHNHLGTNHTQMVKDTIALVPEGGNYKDLPPGWGESRKFHMAWTRLNGNIFVMELPTDISSVHMQKSRQAKMDAARGIL